MNYFIEKILNAIFKFSFWIVSGIFVITIFWAWCFSNIKIDNELDIWFDKNDITYNDYIDFKNHFGDDRNLIIIYKNDSLFSNYQLAENRVLTKKLQQIEGVEKVLSLTNLRIPRITPFQIISTKVIPKYVINQNELNEKVRSLNILIDNLISKDGKATAYQIFTKDDSYNKIINEKVKLLISTIPDSTNYYLAGGICTYEEATRLSSEEPGTFLLIAIFIMIGILFIVFRNYISPLIPIVIAIISIVWTIGILYLAGGSINMLTGIIPLVLLVMSVAFSIHLISSFNKNLQKKPEPIVAIKETYKEVLIPGSIAAFTTSFAFLAFSFSSIIPIRMFGFFTAIGVIISCILTLILLPLIFKKYSNLIGNKSISIFHKNEDFSDELTFFIKSNGKRIFIISLIVFLISIYGISKLRFESDQIKYFKKSNEVRVANDTASSWFNGIYPIELSFDLSKFPDDSLYAYFTKFKTLQNKLLQINDVEICHSAIGLIDAIMAWNKFKFSEEVIFKRIMKSSNLDNQNNFLNLFLSQDSDRFRLTVKTKWINNQEVIELLPKIDNEVKNLLNTDLTPYYITGIATLLAKLNDDLLHAQIISLSFSFLIIFIIFILVFHRPVYFISGILPNLLPVITSIGIMGYLNIPMDVGTVLIASISLGIAVDDTVYLLFAFKNFRKEYQPLEAIRFSYHKVWKALTITTIILSAGFFVLVFSNYTPIIYLGIFVSLNLLFALIYDFLLLPALLISFTFNLKSQS